MEDKRIREKYGGKLPKAINRAIRAEIAGGNAALDKLTQLAGAARHSNWKDPSGQHTAEAQAYYRHKRDIVGRMENEIRKRWGLPPARDEAPIQKRPSTKRPGKPRSGPRRPTK